MLLCHKGSKDTNSTSVRAVTLRAAAAPMVAVPFVLKAIAARLECVESFLLSRKNPNIFQGWCGQGTEYCMAPDCQINYGPGCDANKLPTGGSTQSIARPKLGNQVYGGEGIYACSVAGDVAITYDDGPYIYTTSVLDQFDAAGFKATFFITGANINKGEIDDETTPWPAVIRRMYNGGHQVASHTWSHQDLSAITKAQRIDQMVKNEMAFANIFGKFPTYMRPPYSSCTQASGCWADMKTLGYVVSYFDLDTDGILVGRSATLAMLIAFRLQPRDP
jgi:hypothetical protein